MRRREFDALEVEIAIERQAELLGIEGDGEVAVDPGHEVQMAAIVAIDMDRTDLCIDPDLHGAGGCEVILVVQRAIQGELLDVADVEIETESKSVLIDIGVDRGMRLE